MDAQLKAELEFQNDRAMWDSSELARDALGLVKKDIEGGMISLVYGLRRTGKTFLAHQLISGYRAPFYFSFDKLAFQKPDVLEETIRFALAEGADIIALDEIQKVQGWSGIVKGYYDHQKPRPSFLLTGSSSIGLKKGGESLAGRMLERQLPALSYPEYLRFAGIGAKFRMDKADDYMREGAFPEVVLRGHEPARYARSVVDKIVGEDLPQLYSIEHPEHLPDIVRMLAERIGGKVDYRDLSSSLGISKDTVKRYIVFLEKSFLIDIVMAHGKHGAAVGKNKKAYFAHPQIASAYCQLSPGQAAENAVYCHLRQFGQVGFFTSGRSEIDFVLSADGVDIPIEVKWQNSMRPSDTLEVRKFMEMRGTDGIMITKNEEETLEIGQMKLRLIPLHEFLFSQESPLFLRRHK